MDYYSDHSAAKALGGINSEFSRLEKKRKAAPASGKGTDAIQGNLQACAEKCLQRRARIAKSPPIIGGDTFVFNTLFFML